MKKNHAQILTAILLCVFFIFTASQVAAFSDEPCTGLNYSCDDCNDCVKPLVGMTVTDPETQWTIKLDSVTDLLDGNYDFLYKVTSTPASNSASGLNFVAMLIPDCCVIPKVEIDLDASDPFSQYFAPGIGENTLYFGQYVLSGFVIKGTSDSSVDWHLIANTNKLTMSTMIIKLKKGAITFKMPVPGCTPPPTEKPIGASISSTTYICTNVDTHPLYPISMEYQRDPDTDYAIPSTVKFYRALDCEGVANDPITTTPLPLVYCTGGPGDKLNECIKLTSESPGCVEYYIKGTLCKFCY